MTISKASEARLLKAFAVGTACVAIPIALATVSPFAPIIQIVLGVIAGIVNVLLFSGSSAALVFLAIMAVYVSILASTLFLAFSGRSEKGSA